MSMNGNRKHCKAETEMLMCSVNTLVWQQLERAIIYSGNCGHYPEYISY